jgi:energy-coupling factor transport system permease protein
MIRNNNSGIFKGLLPGLNYMPGESFLHRVHPLSKLVMLILFSIAVFIIDSSVISGIILFVIILLGYISAQLGLYFFWRKMRMIIIFGLMIILVQVIAVKKGFLLLEIPLIIFTLQIWSQGLLDGLKMMMRFLNIIGCSYLFVSVTDPNRLAYSLMQIGLPYRFGFMLITSLRFIPVFQQELIQIRNAQMIKGIDLEQASFRKILLGIRYLLAPLVISSLSKVDSLAISMEGRAFGLYPKRSYLYQQAFRIEDFLFLIFFLAVFIILYAIF